MLMLWLLCIRFSLLFSPINSYWNKADISLWKYRSGVFLPCRHAWQLLQHPPQQSLMLRSQFSMNCTIHLHLLKAECSTSVREEEVGGKHWKMGGFQTGASGLATLCKKSETQGTGKRFKCFQSNFPILSFRCRLREYEVRGKVTTTTMIRPSAHSPTHRKTRRDCWEPWEQWSKQTRNNAFLDTNPGAVLHSGWRAQSTFLLMVPSLES